MKPKHFLAFMCVLGSLCYFAMMSVANLETLSTQLARVLFCLPFLIALAVGVYGLCYLFTEFRKGGLE